ncbi:putative prolyl 4-hydroxylase 7 [Gossypium australe]|uniref:procollagen-proline 4-dioxygenase n=1 Tax=Gossypium australe TaxID=47621 RepID=A0A5B6UGE7_9ROSI|nr:putative prolyl 4-hydroxylase 7 [Gossypium australe]
MDYRYFLGFFLLLLINFALVPAEINGLVLKMRGGTSSVQFDPTSVAQLSWRPRAFIYKGFLSSEECDHLIILAKDKLEKSMVADDVSGQSIESEVRTSSGMFLEQALDEVVADIEARIAAWTFLPVGLFAFDLDTALQTENGEALLILHYQHGQKYEPHFDFFYDKVNLERGGHRIATVPMYLSDVESGGETVFPNSEGKLTQPTDDSWSNCAKTGYAVKPRKGDALLFFNLHPNTTTDPKSLHGSCPVIKGEKWSATKWIHVQSFDNMESQTEDCVDKNGNCPFWAKAGECEKNPAYMVGSEEFTGYCRKSCKVCSS